MLIFGSGAPFTCGMIALKTPINTKNPTRPASAAAPSPPVRPMAIPTAKIIGRLSNTDVGACLGAGNNAFQVPPFWCLFCLEEDNHKFPPVTPETVYADTILCFLSLCQDV